MATNRFLDRAAKATRSSKRVALRDVVDYVELVRDVAAMANSGGGIIVLDGIAGVEEELLHERLGEYAEPEFEGFSVEPLLRNGRPSTAVVVEGAAAVTAIGTFGAGGAGWVVCPSAPAAGSNAHRKTVTYVTRTTPMKYLNLNNKRLLPITLTLSTSPARS